MSTLVHMELFWNNFIIRYAQSKIFENKIILKSLGTKVLNRIDKIC